MNTRSFKMISGMAALLLFASACAVIPVRGSGDLVTETRQVSGYNAIVFSGMGEAEIIQDGSESITIETDDDVMPYVETEVRGGTLYVGLDFDGLRSILPTEMNVTVHVAELTAIDASGTWTVRAESIETGSLTATVSGTGSLFIGLLTAQDLSLNISGLGEMEVSGEVVSQEVDISGTGKYLAGNLQSETARINISGSGKATVWAAEALDVTVSGSGTVEYYGRPQVSFDESGSGEIVGLGDK